MSILKEFREFAIKGNLFDMAIGIVIGTAFGRIVSSLVADIIMPPIGVLLGNVDFKDFKVLLKPAVMQGNKVVTNAVTINYGNFINICIDFLIIAASIFLVIKLFNMLRREQKEPVPTPPTKEEELLTDIRDILRSRNV